MLFWSPSEWWELGRSLGLAPHDPVAGYGTHASFRQLERAAGPRAAPPPRWAHWLCGTRAGRDALVLTYETGSGSSRQTWTAALVRLDPPLFLGATIARQGWLSDLLMPADAQIGIPMFDAELRLGTFDPERLALLLRQDTQLLQALVRCTRDGMVVTDSTVAFELTGVVVDASIAQRLDQAAWVAGELERRRVALPESAAERAQRAEWGAFADARRLHFDPARMTIEGEVEGSFVEIGLETTTRVHTGVTVRWPSGLGGSVRLRKAGALAFLSALFTQDINTGDPVFDERFLIQGSPEPWVRQVFASPDLRATLLSLSSAAELTFDHERCFWLWPGAAPSQRDLEAHLTMATRATRALFGAASRVPYR